MLIPIVKIIPQSFPVVKDATIVLVNNIQVVPGVGASGSIVLGNLDAKDIFIPIHEGSYTVAMTAEQFNNWGTDDMYAVKTLVQNLGLTPLV